MLRTAAACAALLLPLASCATAGGASADGSGGNDAFLRSLITREELSGLPPSMTVFELIRQHARTQVRGGGGGEAILVEDRTTWEMTPQSRWRPARVYLNEREIPAGVSALKELRISEVRRIEILTSTEASARYGGAGYSPVIAIRLESSAGG